MQKIFYMDERKYYFMIVGRITVRHTLGFTSSTLGLTKHRPGLICCTLGLTVFAVFRPIIEDAIKYFACTVR